MVGEGLAQMGFENGRILDVPTGSGEVAICLARTFHDAEVVGLDSAGPRLESARAAAAEAGLSCRVSFEVGNVWEMPFEDDSFDAVVSLDTFHAVDRPIAMLDEVERVLASDGVFLLSDIKRSWLKSFMQALKAGYTPGEVKELLQRSRLRPWIFHTSLLRFGVVVGEPREHRRVPLLALA